MAKQTTLMEWLDQTKKLSKSKDYQCMDAIDNVMGCLWFIDKKMLMKHKDFINAMCEKYHKPNPINIIKSQAKMAELFIEKYGAPIQEFIVDKIKDSVPKTCLSLKQWNSCPASAISKKWLSAYVDGSLGRCETGLEDLKKQWFEVIDFMWERPELINPALIDEYIQQTIADVCMQHKKNNPLVGDANMWKRFGKFWKDADGRWHKEKRHRF